MNLIEKYQREEPMNNEILGTEIIKFGNWLAYHMENVWSLVVYLR